jgi:hypothetical protein
MHRRIGGWPTNYMVLNAVCSIFVADSSSQVQQIPQPVMCQKCKIGRATWGIAGLSEEWIMTLCTVCSQQSSSDNIKKLHGRCTKCTRCAIFGHYKAEHCKAHMEDGDTDLIHTKCSFLGCTRTQPAWGDEHNDARFCREHRQASHIFLTKRTCKHPGCQKSPSFGLAGECKNDAIGIC